MRLRIAVCVSVLISHLFTFGLVIPQTASAASGDILISQLQYAGTANSTDEFIELNNVSAAAVDLTGWQVQYRAATATNGNDCAKGWTTKATVAAGQIAPGGYFLFAPAAYLAADATFSAGLAAAGTVRLLDPAKVTQDALAWGAATCGTGAAAAVPPAGQSLERHEGTAGRHGDNSGDFFVQTAPTIHSTTTEYLPATPAEAPTVDPEAAPETTPEGDAPGLGSAGFARLELTELLVDPAPPYADAQDEFVEIHNPTGEPVDATGYAVRTGSHTAKLPDGPIPADGYVVLTSAGTTISLSNTGGVANLLDPAGNVIDTAGAWGAAEPGASWAFIDGTWVWTLAPTPGAANEYVAVPGAASPEEEGSYAAVELSELLPDPASPLTDAADEFIEIYNPTDQPADLTGYVLKAGHDLGAKYVIKGVTVPAGGYVALRSATTKLSLANDGSSVALYTPGGLQLGSTVTYPKAAAGNSWANLDGGWDWTAEPTPNGANIAAAVAGATAATKATKATKTTKAKTAAKPKTAKTKAATKVKAAKATKSNGKPLLAGASTPGGRWLLYLLAGLTIAYIIYEFRYDLRNYYYKLRGYPVGRPATVPVLAEGVRDRSVERPGRG